MKHNNFTKSLMEILSQLESFFGIKVDDRGKTGDFYGYIYLYFFVKFFL